MISRRTFLDGLAVGMAGAAIGSTAKSYAQILGANSRVNFAVMGLHSRGYAHLSALQANSKTARISHICDVDSTILAKFAGEAQKELGYAPATASDFRKVLESKDVDAISIAVVPPFMSVEPGPWSLSPRIGADHGSKLQASDGG